MELQFFILTNTSFFCNFIMVELQLYLFVMINSVSSLGGGGMGTLSVFECSFSLWFIVPYSGCTNLQF